MANEEMTLRLSPVIYTALAAIAQRYGTTPQAVVEQGFLEFVLRSQRRLQTPDTVADLFSVDKSATV